MTASLLHSATSYNKKHQMSDTTVQSVRIEAEFDIAPRTQLTMAKLHESQLQIGPF